MLTLWRPRAGPTPSALDIQNSGGAYTAYFEGSSGVTITPDNSTTPELGSGVSFGVLLACLAIWGGVANRRKAGADAA